MKVVGEVKIVLLVELHLKNSSMILMKAIKKQLRIGVVFLFNRIQVMRLII